jgi:DNA segregation ATPase FtsK/SpoIIIE, S-DNA-T family
VARRSMTSETQDKKRKKPPPAKKSTRVSRGSSVLSREDRGRNRTSVESVRRRRAALGGEIVLLVLVGVGLLLLLSLLSFHPQDTSSGLWGVADEARPIHNWVGPFGAVISELVVAVLGMTAFALPVLLVLIAVNVFARRSRRIRLGEGLGLVGLVTSLALLVHLVFPDVAFRGDVVAGGGFLGELSSTLLVGWISVPGTWVVGLIGLIISARVAFGVRVFRVGRAVGSKGGEVAGVAAARGLGGVRAAIGGAFGWVGSVFRSTREALADWRYERDLSREERQWEREEKRARLEEERRDEEDRLAADDLYDDEIGEDSALLPPEGRQSRVRRPQPPVVSADSILAPGPVLGEPPMAPADEDLDIGLDSLPVTRTEAEAVAGVELLSEDDDEDLPRVDSMRGATARGVVHARIDVGGRGKASPFEASAPAPARDSAPASVAALEEAVGSPRIRGAVGVERGAERVDRVVSARRFLRQRDEPFELPQLSLLTLPESGEAEVDEEELERQAARLEETLGHYGVEGRVTDILPGPVVTMFEFEPAPGIKVSRIAGLGDDLAMALRAIKVRIVAPIPGKGAVGIEVPSAHREMVHFREVLASKTFRKSKMQLPLALGKGIDGGPVSSDMAKMPHILVAGTTGSGKSVCVNTVILSLLYSRTPEQVRLILVDPKMLEFSVYDGIPHLLVPVVTSPKKAAVALHWAVQEMTRRYKVLSAMGARNIVNYNDKAGELIEQWDAWGKAASAGRIDEKPDCGRAAGEDTVCRRSEGGEPVGPPEKMPYIVIIIDELSDLMMVARKEVEESIVRLAQMARAAGIHMLLATQRPSVDVITGLIKANFPTRLSFRVSSKVDSRTVLDANGAEYLLGLGDGLFLAPGVSDLQRVHGAFVSDDEVKRVVDHLKTQGEPVYVDAVLTDPDADGEDGEDDAELDDMYDQCVAVVAEAGKASTSLLQRRLKLGYNRAARIMDAMEKRGVIGPQDGARPREVYVKPYEF